MPPFLLADRLRSAPDFLASCTEDELLDPRARFIAAADWVLSTDGFANFKVREVCRRAHLSTHCFYEVFESKDELLAAILEKQFRAAGEYLQRTIDPTSPPVDQVWAHVEEMINFCFDQRLDRAFALFATYWRSLLPHYRELAERSVQALLLTLVNALAEGQAGGVLRSPDPAADAMAIYHLITALFFDRPVHTVHQEEMASTVRRFVARALDLR